MTNQSLSHLMRIPKPVRCDFLFLHALSRRLAGSRSMKTRARLYYPIPRRARARARARTCRVQFIDTRVSRMLRGRAICVSHAFPQSKPPISRKQSRVRARARASCTQISVGSRPVAESRGVEIIRNLSGAPSPPLRKLLPFQDDALSQVMLWPYLPQLHGERHTEKLKKAPKRFTGAVPFRRAPAASSFCGFNLWSDFNA